MNKIFTLLLTPLFFSAFAGKNVEGTVILGNASQVKTKLYQNTSVLKIDDQNTYTCVSTFSSPDVLSGTLAGYSESNYFISTKNNKVSGFIIVSKKDDIAYQYKTLENGDVSLTRISMHKIMCVDFTNTELTKQSVKTNQQVLGGPAQGPVPSYSSLPGSSNVLYLDFDGYDLPAGTAWNSGATLTAAASGYTDTEIYQAWSIVAEDYAPFDVNITTDENTFLAADTMTRIRMVFTPTSNWYGNAGGVAYVGVFNYWDKDYKTGWVFVNNMGGSAKNAGEACSHEAGHTLGLQHHGTVVGTDSTEYYAGHGNWGAIMGAAYGKALSQFSSGEYSNAFCYEYDNNNNKVAIQQDDISVVSGYISLKADDYGNTINNATDLVYTLNNTVGTVDSASNNGLIGSRSDVDVFHFYTGGGGVNLDFVPSASFKTNLDIEVKLYDNNNILQSTFNTTHNSTCINGVNINQNLSAGFYYLIIDGVGSGDATTGWSDYNSMGPYHITGTINNPDINTNAVNENIVNHINVFPNPLNGSNILNLSSKAQQVQVYDVSGKLLKSDLNCNNIDMSALAQGMYTVHLMNDGESTIVKIIK